jgi:NADH-quinone oxidoreductase subunit G
VFPPGDAREDWAIFRALSEHLGAKLPYDTLTQLRQAIYAAHPHLAAIDQVRPGDLGDINRLASVPGTTNPAPFVNAVQDFYLTNPIARASRIMAEMSALRSGPLAVAAE